MLPSFNCSTCSCIVTIARHDLSYVFIGQVNLKDEVKNIICLKLKIGPRAYKPSILWTLPGILMMEVGKLMNEWQVH